MATPHDEELFDFDEMTDEEIRSVVVQQLRDYPNVDADWIRVFVRDGFVTLSGQVGTDGEYQVAEAVLHDVLGVEDYSNELTVGELHRGEAPAGADEAVVEDEEIDDQLGEVGSQQSDTAEHISQHLESDTYGTHDLGTSIRDGTAYVPPDRPIADGYDSREDH
ncbi:MAG TPA: BON domain-containing protein [Longimicrobiaceae bacterium]|nr:BON domain-containing protein [Longimicrobiaceae bacterium]